MDLTRRTLIEFKTTLHMGHLTPASVRRKSFASHVEVVQGVELSWYWPLPSGKIFTFSMALWKSLFMGRLACTPLLW